MGQTVIPQEMPKAFEKDLMGGTPELKLYKEPRSWGIANTYTDPDELLVSPFKYGPRKSNLPIDKSNLGMGANTATIEQSPLANSFQKYYDSINGDNTSTSNIIGQNWKDNALQPTKIGADLFNLEDSMGDSREAFNKYYMPNDPTGGWSTEATAQAMADYNATLTADQLVDNGADVNGFLNATYANSTDVLAGFSKSPEVHKEIIKPMSAEMREYYIDQGIDPNTLSNTDKLLGAKNFEASKFDWKELGGLALQGINVGVGLDKYLSGRDRGESLEKEQLELAKLNNENMRTEMDALAKYRKSMGG